MVHIWYDSPVVSVPLRGTRAIKMIYMSAKKNMHEGKKKKSRVPCRCVLFGREWLRCNMGQIVLLLLFHLPDSHHIQLTCNRRKAAP